MENETICEDCNGTGKARCARCVHGLIKVPGLIPGSTMLAPCPNCGGTQYFKCLTCNGTGKVRVWHDASRPAEEATEEQHNKCEHCDGTGWLRCSKCGGGGYLSGETPPGYIGLPIRSTCDRCYGRGGERCYKCGGRGYL